MAFCRELDAFMFAYEPYREGKNPKHNGSDSQTLNYWKSGKIYNRERKTEFCERICTWLKNEVESLNGPVVIAIAPGHDANPNPTGFMHEIVGSLLANLSSVFDGRCQLIRTKTVPKQSITPGVRYAETHRGTIGLGGPTNNTGKVVVILDDIWTSGNTLRVCEEVMSTTNPVGIKLFAIGKTVPDVF